jgi:paraquat-inducible protein B
VTLGRVGKIGFAPDHRMVEVRMDFDVSTLRQMGVPKEVPPDLRVQLESQGILGTRFVAIEFFDPATHPPPVLSFAPPENYIPSTPSLQKSLEDSLSTSLDRLAQIMDALVREGVTHKVVQALDDVDQLLGPWSREKLPARAASALDDARTALGKINKALDRVDGESGLISSAQGAVKTFGDAGKNADATARNLSATLNEMRAAAAAIRSLAEELERNPDMLIKGVDRPEAP